MSLNLFKSHFLMNKIKTYILGAGGHTRSLISLLKNQSIEIAGIFDETFDPKKEEIIMSCKVLGPLPSVDFLKKIVLSYGDNIKRKSLFEKYKNLIINDTICHSTTYIDESVIFGTANFIFARSYLNARVELGNNNIINTGAIIEHEVKIGSHNHISVGVIICGRVKIGDECFIGAGTVINDKITICNGVTIGSNSVVIRNILEPGTYVGNPARKLL